MSKVRYQVRAIPKPTIWDSNPKPLFSWHYTKEEALKSAKICRSKPQYKSARVEKILDDG